MDYKERYEQALKKAKSIYRDATKEHCSHTDWLEHIFPEIQESEDEKIRNEIIEYIKSRRICTPHDIYDSWIAWLEKQKPVEWNEEDERISDNCISFLNAVPAGDATELNECYDWLKSIRPNHWKPSKEQMVYLKDAINKYDFCDGERDGLESLYEQLQKL